MSRNLTLHFLNNIPYSNLNRDDSGTPKRVTLGHALRALHSSQSIKRGIRSKYEEASGDRSFRSGNLAEKVVEIALKKKPDADAALLQKKAKTLIGNLTKEVAADKEADRSAWMSKEEICAAATTILKQIDTPSDDEKNSEPFIHDGVTGSLAIASFGRMFANAATKGTEAAIAVSPGITTHAALIESDYFSTGDDLREEKRETGATFLGVSRFITGTFYRSVTIDKEQLRKSWSGFELEDAPKMLSDLVRAIVYGAPRGKENSTAPYTLPSLIIAEEQRYRCAFNFETPVQAGRASSSDNANLGDGGYEQTSIDELNRQYSNARRFDPGNFGPLELVSGTADLADDAFEGALRTDLDGLIDRVVEWILN